MSPANPPDTARNHVGVQLLDDDSPWWSQIDTDPAYSIYHTAAWKRIVTNVFGHQPYYLAAAVQGSLSEVLPMYRIHHPLLGSKLVSTPYEGCYGGFSSNDQQVRDQIIERVIQIGNRCGARHVEIRSDTSIEGLVDRGFVEERPLLVTQVELADEATNWLSLSASHRRNVRTAVKRGVSIESASSIDEMFEFFRILSLHFRQLGIPFFSRRYFEFIWHDLIAVGHAHLLLAKKNGVIFGGHLLFSSGSVMISKYSALLRSSEYKKSYASYGLFWEAIRFGIKAGKKYFNMGVTGASNTGLLDFKGRFGATTKPVYFYVLPLRGEVPDYSKYYGGYRLLKRAWKLVPRVAAEYLGQRINSWIC